MAAIGYVCKLGHILFDWCDNCMSSWIQVETICQGEAAFQLLAPEIHTRAYQF